MSAPNKYGSAKTKQLMVSTTAGKGGLAISDTADHEGQFCGILVLAAAVGAVGGKVNVDGDLSALTMPVGAYIPMSFQSIKLASGKIIAYYA